jgi:hypothetical protein
MHQAGSFNPALGAERRGLKDLKNKAMTLPQAFDTPYADMFAHAKGMELYAPLWRHLVGTH